MDTQSGIKPAERGEAAKPKRNLRPVMAAIGCAIILMTGFGSASVIVAAAPLIIQGLGTGLLEYSIGPMAATVIAFVVATFGARLIDIITPRYCLLGGSLCVFGYLLMAGHVTTLPMWYAAHILLGLVLSLGSQAAAAGIIAEFYGEKAPSAFGVVVGVTAFLIAGEVFVESVLLTLMSYQTMLTIYAFAALVLGLFANLVLIGRPAKGKNAASAAPSADGSPTQAGGADSTGAREPEATGVTLGEALKSPALYLFFAAMVIASFAYQGYASYATYYYTNFGMTPSTAAALFSGFELMTAVFALGSGVVARKIGVSISSALLFVGFSVGIFLLIGWSASGSTAFVLASVALCSLIGLVQSIPALFVPQIFGMKDYTAINAVGIGGMQGGSAILFLIISIIIEGFGYNMGFALLSACAIVAMLLFILSMALRPIRKQPGANTAGGPGETACADTGAAAE